MQKEHFPCAQQLNIMTIFAKKKKTLLKYKTMQSLCKIPYYKNPLQTTLMPCRFYPVNFNCADPAILMFIRTNRFITGMLYSKTLQ